MSKATEPEQAICRCGQRIVRDGEEWRDGWGSRNCGGVMDKDPHAPREGTR